MNKSQFRERNKAIVAELKTGRWTLEQLGCRYGISRERVRQIALEHGVRSRRYDPKPRGKTCTAAWCGKAAYSWTKTSLGKKPACKSHCKWGEDILREEPFKCCNCGKPVRRNSKRCNRCHTTSIYYHSDPVRYFKSWRFTRLQQESSGSLVPGEYRACYQDMKMPWGTLPVAERMVFRVAKKFPGEHVWIERHGEERKELPDVGTVEPVETAEEEEENWWEW